MSHSQNGCCSAGLSPLHADLRTSVHSVLRCASTPPTPPNFVAPHPCAASSDLTCSLLGGDLRPAQRRTTRAPGCKTRGSCLPSDCPTLDSASNSCAPNNSSWLHMPPSSPPPNASPMTAHPPRQKIGPDQNNLQSHWTAGISLCRRVRCFLVLCCLLVERLRKKTEVYCFFKKLHN